MATNKALATYSPAPTERVRHRDLLNAGAWVVASFVIFSAANYAFSLALSRLLPVAEYGSFGVLSSIFLLEGLLATAGFPWMLSTTVARFRGPENAPVRASALSTALIGNTALGIITGVLVALATHRLVHGHPVLPLLAAAAAFFTCTNAVWLGLYQGERRFPLQAGLRTVDSVTKCVAGVVMVLAGLKLEGAIGGVIAGAALVTLWGATRVRGFGRPGRGQWIDRASLPTVAWTAAAQLGFGLLMNMDILAVRALGTSGGTAAGYYQAASVLARAPVFVALAVLNAIFPFLAGSMGDAAVERRLLRTTLRVITLLPIPAATLLLAAPDAAISLFFPVSYAPAVPLLRISAAAALPLITLGAAVLSLQATRGMRSAAAGVLPAALLEALLLLYAVPRYGAVGAAWSLLLAATAGSILTWLVASRRWPLSSIAPSPRLLLALLCLGLAQLALPVHGRLWLLETVVLGAAFVVLVWVLRAISAAELVPLAPPPLRPLLAWVGEHEPETR